MRTLVEKLGQAETKQLIDKKIRDLLEWAESNGVHVGVCLIDAGGKEFHNRVFDIIAGGWGGSHITSGAMVAVELLNMVAEDISKDSADSFKNLVDSIYKCLRKIEKEYWKIHPDHERVVKESVDRWKNGAGNATTISEHVKPKQEDKP